MSFSIIPYSDIDFDQWLEFTEQQTGYNLFYHPAYLKASSVLGPEWHPTHALVKQEGGKYTFGLILQLEKGLEKGQVLQVYGFRGADHVEPMVLGEDFNVDDAIEYLIKELQPSLICGNSLTERFADAILKVSGTKSPRKAKAFRCPYINLPANEDEFYARYSTNFRSQLRRKVKKATKNGIEFRFVDSKNMPEGYSLSEALKNLVRVHSMRFEELGKSSRFLEDTPQTFFKELCRTTGDYPEYISFTEAVHEGQVVGSFLGLRNSKRYNYIISGFDETYNEYSMGRLLIFHSMRFCMERQVPVFDFIRGTEQYKFGWTELVATDYNVLAPINLKGRVTAEKMRWDKAAKRKGRFAGTVEWLKRNDK